MKMYSTKYLETTSERTIEEKSLSLNDAGNVGSFLFVVYGLIADTGLFMPKNQSSTPVFVV